MTFLRHMRQAFGIDQRGVTAMEYGLIAGVMSVGLIAAMTSIRLKLIEAINNFNF